MRALYSRRFSHFRCALFLRQYGGCGGGRLSADPPGIVEESGGGTGDVDGIGPVAHGDRDRGGAGIQNGRGYSLAFVAKGQAEIAAGPVIGAQGVGLRMRVSGNDLHGT